ncbi:S-adenosylmethionine decarboxylase proenzyme [Grifola frondosa]|uniref:S-adenosylmethionine decarboxylase proenzyme n=1 Tax=Grifola frondosa TaxID=5627 RepID=A0A1C7LVB6_GRIFR|nr:S-adenosylmethionine decarboxylase proenzyme [Grifola frondosa]
MTTPGEDSLNGSTAPSSPVIQTHPLPDTQPELPSDEFADRSDSLDTIAQDYTIEILMTHLSPAGRAPFMNESSEDADINPSEDALALSSSLGITELFPPHLTTLDAYSFSPCGYSCNALLKWRDNTGADSARSGEGYYTIHVTPEEGWSYASFECNVPLPTDPAEKACRIPDLKTLIRRVVNIFQPGRLTLTLFVSSEDNSTAEEEGGESAVEAAQRAFKAALTLPRGRLANGDAETQKTGGFTGIYKRTDKINYEFGGYDLAFASFELRS